MTNKKTKMVTEDWNGEEYRFYPLGEFIVRAPAIWEGRPTFKYTHIEVAAVLGLFADGLTTDEIVSKYRGKISREAALASFRVASELFKKPIYEGELVVENDQDEPYEYYPLGEYVVSAPEVRIGIPTIKNTRIDVWWILKLLADGETIEELVEDYDRYFPEEGVIEVIRIAASRLGVPVPELQTV
ncbi:MAG: DUF433 domain-containing protein [Planctomycetes bacterium]|nr:DUF433 domain-containing protein [Planctomycetota bacterium]